MSDDPTPRDGRSLYRWAIRQQELHGCGMVRFLNTLGRRRGYPRKIVDWNSVEAMEGFSEAMKALRRYLK